MRTLVVVALLLMLAVAGCTSKGDGKGSDGTSSSSSKSGSGSGTSSGSGTKTSSGTGTGSSTATGTGATGANHPPLAALTAVIQGLTVTFNVTGNDTDGDALSWNLAFGDNATANGTKLPGNTTHAYAAAGSFTAVLNVTDGKATTRKTLAINVTAPSGGGDPVVLTGHITGPDPLAMAGGGTCFIAIFTLLPGFPSELGGHFGAEAAWAGWTFQTSPAGIATYITDSGGGQVGGGESGTMPAGAADIFTCGTGPDNVDQDYTVTITPP